MVGGGGGVQFRTAGGDAHARGSRGGGGDGDVVFRDGGVGVCGSGGEGGGGGGCF